MQLKHQPNFYYNHSIKFPSVSTILTKTKPEKDIFRLNSWRKRVGYDKANLITNNSRNRGRSLNNLLLDLVYST